MDIYTVVDNQHKTLIHCTDAESSDPGVLDISTLAHANGDDSDRLEIVGIKWMIQEGECVRLAWGDGDVTGESAGTDFITLVGKSNGFEGISGSYFTADELEDATTSGDLYITPSGDEFTVVIMFKKTAGFSGYPSVLSDEEPMGGGVFG
tara:strand:+ start:582 stop:1031 length:450 start_codon:yes stop_codon:yes gene_type:complete